MSRLNQFTETEIAEMQGRFVDAMCDSQAAAPVTWGTETRRLIRWLEHHDLPDSFRLNAWTLCTDGAGLKRTLLSRVDGGPVMRGGIVRRAAEAAVNHIRDLRAYMADRGAR